MRLNSLFVNEKKENVSEAMCCCDVNAMPYERRGCALVW